MMVTRRTHVKKSSHVPSYCTTCQYGYKGALLMLQTCGHCEKIVCTDVTCDREAPAHYCRACECFWCDDCLQENMYCHYCNIPHCPTCEKVVSCMVCEEENDACDNGINAACTLCCKKHIWHWNGNGWVCEEHDQVPLYEELKLPQHVITEVSDFEVVTSPSLTEDEVGTFICRPRISIVEWSSLPERKRRRRRRRLFTDSSDDQEFDLKCSEVI